MAQAPNSPQGTPPQRPGTRKETLDFLLRQREPLEIIRQARSGVEFRTAMEIFDLMGASREQAARILGLSARTLQRPPKTGTFGTEESEKMLRLAEVLRLGLEVLGGPERLRHWMHQPLRALGDRSPLELADTFTGIAMVEQTLGRLAYGVYS